MVAVNHSQNNAKRTFLHLAGAFITQLAVHLIYIFFSFISVYRSQATTDVTRKKMCNVAQITPTSYLRLVLNERDWKYLPACTWLKGIVALHTVDKGSIHVCFGLPVAPADETYDNDRQEISPWNSLSGNRHGSTSWRWAARESGFEKLGLRGSSLLHYSVYRGKTLLVTCLKLLAWSPVVW